MSNKGLVKSIKFLGDTEIQEQETFIEDVLNNIKDNKEIGLAGYLNQQALKRDLRNFIFGNSSGVKLASLSSYQSKIRSTIQETIKKCNGLIKIPAAYVFVFPTQSPHIKEMNGVNGFTPYKKVFHLYINCNIENWEKDLSSMIAHESAHLISRERFSWETLLDSIVFEGLAQHFRQKVVEGEKPKWAKAISKQKAESIIKELDKEQLESQDYEVYRDLFFGSKNFPKWSGYTIGYLIIDEIISSQDISLTSLMQKPPREVFKMYDQKK